ncbi:centrosomal protein of 128 kDa isoform X2 [Colossoma macropomum]|uniref:centrosomal protein of 128 kDa isoform X2 n=1 Tax=Colossoma macropomum TaxID=42526 RepID=UPI001863C71F|nr:centrosomal protein of 128 kDa isoform X2 [Colossoma macropomum]
MESSSESEIYSRSREHCSRGRDALRRKTSRDIAMDSVGIAEKIDALADTLQDTSRNLNKVDQMLGQYREHTDDHADAIATLQESLEESIHQLQSQRLKRPTRGCSASFSTLHSSLEDGNNFGGRPHNPTSPLKDYRSLEMSNRRSTVRFRDPCQTEEQIHSLHQAFRDLRSDQLQLGHEIDQEILKRNRSDIETRKTLVDLTKQIQESPMEEAVSFRVEKRLQKIESEILSQQQMVSERHCKDQRGNVSSELQEALKRRDAQNHPSEDSYRNRFLTSESEICKLEQELKSARKQLDRSESGRGALFQQMEDMQAQLLRSERERAQLQREISLLRFQHRSVTELQERAAEEGLRQGGKVLERELEDLRVQLCQNSSFNETQELKRTVERKENEKKQLALQIEALSSDLERRDHQQLQILKEVQALSEDRGAELAQVEAQLAENEKKKEELRTKAKEAIRQWKAKCRKLECQLQELKERQGMNQPTQALAERENVLRQQIEGTRKQLAEVLGHLAQREEEVRQCCVDLAEARSQLVILKQELRDSRESLRSLEDETQRQSLIQTRLREENQKLEKQLEDLGNRREQEQGNLLELQALVKSLNAEHANLNGRLAEAESFRKEQEKRLALAQEEKASLGQQLQLEREVHQRELDHLRQQEDKIKQNHSVQKTLRLYHQEREELKALIKDLKAEAVVDKELVRVLQQKLDRMKAECDNLTEQLSSSEESHAKLHKMCQMLKNELEVKIQFSEQVKERRHAAEDSMAEMQNKIADLKLEQTSILHALESQINLACKAVCKDSATKLKAVMLTSGQQNDCHHWLAEMKTKLQWLCDEVRVHETQEKKLTRVVQQCKEQMKTLKQSRDSEQQNLLDRITQLERLLQDIHSQKQDLLEKSHRKDDEMRSLQDRVLDLEMSTRLALDHLESVPEKLSLLEDFKDLEESQRQREAVEQRYAKYKEVVGALQYQLEEAKRRIQEYRDEKLDATSWSLHLDGLSSSLRSQFLTAPHRCLDSLDGLECAAAVSKNTVLQTTVQTLNR